jgi:signal transduction histidine kinase
MQLLALYKLDQKQLTIRPVPVELQDFLEDCAASASPIATHRDVTITCQAEDELEGTFDPDLVGIAVQNVLANSLRYAHKEVRLSAWQENEGEPFTVIQVEDDGAGYPDAMLTDPGNFIRRISRSTGSTGLGLHFASTVAMLHRRHGRYGTITLDNHGTLGGGRFSIRLP